MMGPNICFKGVIWKIIPKLSLLPLLIWTTGSTEPLAQHIKGGTYSFPLAALSFADSKQVPNYCWVDRDCFPVTGLDQGSLLLLMRFRNYFVFQYIDNVPGMGSLFVDI